MRLGEIDQVSLSDGEKRTTSIAGISDEKFLLLLRELAVPTAEREVCLVLLKGEMFTFPTKVGVDMGDRGMRAVKNPEVVQL